MDFTMTGELDPAAEALTAVATALESVVRGDSPTPGSSVRLVAHAAAERVPVAA
ncbi:hypothetical protein OG413_06735 [Streptomyces sp. NBC_01433]|uniref:hypothetical protein n=1 Tax=Streptomyces sp. NBC_01433 TaxID=2903864 RepID=UPI00225B8168|nr:hypothetical protein [Streptomyces sp. NBC_01433]MCX4675022.1 hypothetical protein [Streptomyces sp. NBC_01433]